jgi:hypothetical protein
VKREGKDRDLQPVARVECPRLAPLAGGGALHRFTRRRGPRTDHGYTVATICRLTLAHPPRPWQPASCCPLSQGGRAHRPHLCAGPVRNAKKRQQVPESVIERRELASVIGAIVLSTIKEYQRPSARTPEGRGVEYNGPTCSFEKASREERMAFACDGSLPASSCAAQGATLGHSRKAEKRGQVTENTTAP